jgi:hypothetical protein
MEKINEHHYKRHSEELERNYPHRNIRIYGEGIDQSRIWFQAIDEKGNIVYKPSQKGIALNVSQFAELKDGIERIGNYINDKQSDASR